LHERDLARGADTNIKIYINNINTDLNIIGFQRSIKNLRLTYHEFEEELRPNFKLRLNINVTSKELTNLLTDMKS
jgi:hypothetical protein